MLFLVMESTELKGLVGFQWVEAFWAGTWKTNHPEMLELIGFRIQNFEIRARGEVVIAPGDTSGDFLQLEKNRFSTVSRLETKILSFFAA